MSVPSAVLTGVMMLALSQTGCGRHSGGSAPADGEEAAVPANVQVSLASARRQTVRATIPVTGVLAPLPNNEAKVAPAAAGRIRAMCVKAGDRVTKGQVLAVLESGPLLGQVQQAEATVRADAATLLQTRLNLRSQEASQRSAVAQARMNLRTQQVGLDKLLAGSRPQEVAQAQTAVTVAEAALTNAQQGLTRSRTLYGGGLLARKDLEAAQAQETTAKAQVRSAEAALSLARQGNRPQDIEAGRVAVRQAEEGLRTAQAQAVQNAAKAQDVRVAERQLQGAEGALRAARAQMSALTIRSPLSGTVVGSLPNPGEAVDVTGTIATIVNLNRVRVLLSVPAAQIGAVRKGQVVEYTIDQDPGATYRAAVTVVSSAVDPNSNTVPVEAIGDNTGGRLRDDGFVRGNIVVAVHADALSVPMCAVVTRGDKSVVFVVGGDNKAHMKTVTVGLRVGQWVEVLSGVGPDDRLVTTGSYELEDGTSVSQSDGAKAARDDGATAK